MAKPVLFNHMALLLQRNRLQHQDMVRPLLIFINLQALPALPPK